MMRRLRTGCFVVMLLLVTLGAGNQTINTVPSTSTPSSAASFATDLSTFLSREDSARQAELFPQGMVVSGGLHSTSASLVSPAFATVAYTTSGNRVAQAAASINYSAMCGATATAWVAVSASATSPISGFVRSGSTAYFVNCQSGSTKPTLPADSLLLMQVALVSSQITAIADLRPLTPLVSANLSRIINVTQPPYQVPRDGQGDAAPGINAALVDASAQGQAVFLPCGTYRTLATLTLQNNVPLFGAGSECTTIAPATTVTLTPVILGTSVSKVSVRDLEVDCGDAALVRQGIVGRNAVSRMAVEGVTVRRCGGMALAIDDTSVAPYSSGGQAITWRNNRLDMTGIPGGVCAGTVAALYMPRGPAGFLAQPSLLVEDNVIIASAVQQGITVRHGQSPKILNNTVLSGPTCAGAGTNGGLVVTTNQDAIVAQNAVQGARVGMVIAEAYLPNASGGNEVVSRGMTVQTNKFIDWTVQGIAGVNGTTDTHLVDNQLWAANGGDGITFQPPVTSTGGVAFLRLNILENKVINAENSLLLIGNTDNVLGYDNLLVSKNTLSARPSSNGYGILVNRAPAAQLTTNRIIGHGVGIELNGGVLLGAISQVNLSHNNLEDLNQANTAGQSCFAIRNATSPRLIGNNCRNSSGAFHAKYGIVLDNILTPLIAENLFQAMELGDIQILNQPTQPSPRPYPQAYLVDTTFTIAPANTAENIIATVTMERSYFTTVAGVTIVAYGETGGAGSPKNLKLYFGGTIVAPLLTVPTGFSYYRFEADVAIPESPPTTQHAYLTGRAGLAVLVSETKLMSVDTTASTIEIKVTCTKGTAGDTCQSGALLVKPWR